MALYHKWMVAEKKIPAYGCVFEVCEKELV